MEDQCSDCPCKKQRVSNSQNRLEENNLPLDQSDVEGTNGSAKNETPNSEPENQDDGGSMCGRSLLDCLTETSNLSGSTCTDTDAETGEETGNPVDMFAKNSEEKETCTNQRVRHDIARVVQDTMAALAENNYIRNREAGLQAIRDRETKMQGLSDRESGMQTSRDIEMQAMNCSSVQDDITSSVRNMGNDQIDSTLDVSNTVDENCSEIPFPGLLNMPVETGENIMEGCDMGDMGYNRKTACEANELIDIDLNSCSNSNVDKMSQARSEASTNHVSIKHLEPQCLYSDNDQDDDELNVDRPGFLSDSGFINLFSNCRNLSSNPECLGVGGDCLQRQPTNKDRYSCTVNDRGDASAITQNASSVSSDTAPSSDLKIKSLILDNIFKYIPCGGGGSVGTIKHPALCRPSNSRFNLEIKYLNEIVSQNNINSLPPQILVHIFRYLSIFTLLRKVSLVCKYWYNWCRDQDLWKNINLMNQHKLTDVHLQQLISFSDRVISVNLTDCRFVTNVGIKILLARCTHIQVLKLMRCFDITDEAFKEVCEKKLCSQLRCLRLDGCCKLNDATIVKVAKACPLLQILHINQCTKITDHSIKVLADHCPRLTQLLMDHCSQVTEEGIEAIVQGCPYMTYLNIMSCGVTDRGVKLLANLKHLTNLDLSNIPRLTPDAVVYLSRHCKNLECINISLNSVMNDHCVTELARNLPKLKRLYCVSCNISDAGLEKIAEFRPTLEALDVGWCQDITDNGVCVISDACTHLDYFGLIRCDQVTMETVEQLVLKYPHVNYSTFVLESRRLMERAQREGFMFGVPVN